VESEGNASITVSPTGRVVAVGAGKFVKLFDLTTGRDLSCLTLASGTVTALVFSPDGRHVAAGSSDGRVEVWDVSKGGAKPGVPGDGAAAPGEVEKLRQQLDEARRREQEQRDQAAAARRQAELALYASHIALAQQAWRRGMMEQSKKALNECPPADRGWEWHYLRRLAAADGKLGAVALTLKGHSNPVTAVAFSPDGKALATASVDLTVRLWAASTGKEERSLVGHRDVVASVAYSPDGARLASASYDGTVRLWDPATGIESGHCFQTHDGKATAVAFSPDGKRLAAGIGDWVALFDAATGHEVCAWNTRGRVYAVAFSPDGKRLAATNYNAVKLWRVDGKELQSLPTRGDNGRPRVTFSPDGKLLAFPDGTGAVGMWDVATGKQVRLLRGHEEAVTAVAFSPDGQRLAAGEVKGTIKLWSPASGELVYTPQHSRSGQPVNALAFSPDGHLLAAAWGDVVLIYSAPR
jgi:WD40 repeat protein